MKTENKQRVIDFLNEQGINQIDFNYHLKDQEFTTADEIRDILEDAGAFDVEIIYYGRAIEYLQQNDPSLRESLGIASDYGFELKNLSSEVLASLLASQNTREEFNEVMSELEDICNEIEEEESNQEEE